MAKRIIVVTVAVGLLVLVYLIVSRSGRIPPMPGVIITESELAQATDALHKRAAGFQMTGETAALTERMHRKHLAEVAAVADKGLREAAQEQVAAFGLAAKALAATDPSRYLLLGDFLAVEFEKAFFEVVRLAGQEGLAKVAHHKPLMTKLEETGGTFFFRVRDQGVIDASGRLAVSRIVPQVLFRVVWRDLAGLGLTLGLSRIEEKAYYDYRVRMFRKRSSERLRLKAIRRLAQLDGDYDDVLAEGLVFYESGKKEVARRVIEEAIEKGRDDADILSFRAALDH